MQDERVVDLVVHAGHFVPLDWWQARRGSQKFDAKLLKILPECLPELPALANVVIVVAPRQPLATLHESNSMGRKRKKKNANQHINSLQFLNTTWFTPSGRKMSQIKKKTSYMSGIHKNVQARANPVCAVHRPCLRKDRKRAGMSRSGTSRATQHGWSSSAASGAASWVAKNAGSQ